MIKPDEQITEAILASSGESADEGGGAAVVKLKPRPY
jgi:hypothetical protein